MNRQKSYLSNTSSHTVCLSVLTSSIIDKRMNVFVLLLNEYSSYAAFLSFTFAQGYVVFL